MQAGARPLAHGSNLAHRSTTIRPLNEQPLRRWLIITLAMFSNSATAKNIIATKTAGAKMRHAADAALSDLGYLLALRVRVNGLILAGQ